MNERIRDLQIQAFESCKTFEDGNIRTDEVFEKFAQLVVRECVALAYQAEPYKANDLILKHFGIEDLQPCKSPYCECDVNKCSHPGFYDARGES